MEYGLVVVWLVAYLALGLAALPPAAVLFERLPDRGAGVALPLALALVTLPAYWVGHVAFGLPALLAGLVVLLGSTALARWRFDASPDWRAASDTAAVFAAAFGFMVAVRAVDPAVHPFLGEKFLDYGVMRATLRADQLPPEDFWFAGEPLAYYYGGHLMAALLATLTGTAANYAYNLALAGFYASYVTAAYGVGGAIGRARGTSRRLAGLSAAFFVAIASNLATPLRALAGVVPPSLLAIAAPEKAETFARGLAAFSYWPASRAMANNLITEFPLFAWLNGDMHAHMMSPPFTLLVVALLFAYFRTPAGEVRRRRLLVFGCLPPLSGLLVFVNTWTALTPAGLTALTLYFAPADPTTLLPAPVGRPLRRFAGAAGDREAAAADGGVAVVDEGLLARAREAVRVEGVRGATAGTVAAAVMLAGLVFVVPFLLGPASGRAIEFWPANERTELTSLLVAHGGFVVVFLAYLDPRFERQVEGYELPVLLALLVVLAVGVAQSFPAFGLFAPLVLVAWTLLRSDTVSLPGSTTPDNDGTEAMPSEEMPSDEAPSEAAPSDEGTPADASGEATAGPDESRDASVPAPLADGVPLALVAVVLVPVVLAVVLEVAPRLAVGVVLAAPLALLGRVGRAAVAPTTDPEAGTDLDVGFEALLMIAGAGLVTIVEVVYVVEYAGPGRFNTVFKTYAQVWALWAVAAGAMFATLLRNRVLGPLAATLGGRGTGDRAVPTFAVAASVLLVASLSLYGGLALSKHFAGNSIYDKHQRADDPTLNATAFVWESHPEEAPAIAWLDEREGTPTIVTAPGFYRWNAEAGKGAAAPASLTGLPTVIGWPHHERGFRGPEGIRERVRDVRTIYTGNRSARACLLAKYDVQYVYVGPAEAAKYGDAVEAIGAVEGVGEPKVFSDGAVRIYPVDQSALPDVESC